MEHQPKKYDRVRFRKDRDGNVIAFEYYGCEADANSFRPCQMHHMNELSELARQGKLTTQEQAELDSYLHVSNLLAVMQSKGRRAFQGSTQ